MAFTLFDGVITPSKSRILIFFRSKNIILPLVRGVVVGIRFFGTLKIRILENKLNDKYSKVILKIFPSNYRKLCNFPIHLLPP